MQLDADQLIATLQLAPHPEGGFYRETFRAPVDVRSPAHAGPRSASTAIYFLLRSEDYSAFHRVRSDEVWHHYLGDPLELSLIDPAGTLRTIRLGKELAQGELPQAIVPSDVLQAARIAPCEQPRGFVLCGCTVAPGFDFADFELPSRAALSAAYPAHAALFAALCRG